MAVRSWNEAFAQNSWCTGVGSSLLGLAFPTVTADWHHYVLFMKVEKTQEGEMTGSHTEKVEKLGPDLGPGSDLSSGI